MPTVNLERLPPQARLELLDFYEFLLNKYGLSQQDGFSAATSDNVQSHERPQPRLGTLAIALFGAEAGIDVPLPPHSPHEPLEFDH